MDYLHWLKQATSTLAASDSAKRDAEILLASVTGRSRAFLLAFSETELTEAETEQLSLLLARRQRGEPIAYLLGEREFWSLPLAVSPATLIPRPDTECLVELALARLPTTPCQILDLGTGSGAIALALASERGDCQITGVDLQPDAVALAQHNAAKLAIKNVEFKQGSWFSPVAGQRFDLIVSNPPYIDETDPHLQLGDVRFEPHSALVAADNGLADLASIVDQAKDFLLPNALLLLEHGWQQGSAVRGLLQQAGFITIETHRDYGGNDRVTLARSP
ncbi:peptide chain release factor N(5)-glutamine methyltransferase [Serratia microhaemolytica]|uniref:peptide chain release factor N(5)-glutamine methyltransferase n=1 Tax=Serratia microhaemolytica TaxID=2675110 RepID=UPI000FDD0201|nr:peptide chain release factor N(5)-glutamine methyltransferase [Serratia microhaemolytica]